MSSCGILCVVFLSSVLLIVEFGTESFEICGYPISLILEVLAPQMYDLVL